MIDKTIKDLVTSHSEYFAVLSSFLNQQNHPELFEIIFILN